MLGLSTAITKAVSAGRTYVKDGLKLYMPYRGSDASEVKFVGTGSTYFVTNDYVDTGATFQTTFDGSFTISCWVKPDDGRPDSYQYICGIYGVSGGLNRITLINGTSGELNLRYRANDAGSGDVSIDSASIWANGESTWKHIVAVGDSTVSGSGGLKLYVNGEEIASGNTSSVTFSNFNTVHNFILGSASFATSGAIETYTFDGSIKNVAIWNRALTATEVQNVMYKSYVNVSGRLASGLVSWWALDASSLGSELLSNSSFSSWTGDDPDNWIISGETADNYVTQNGADADYVIGNPSANPSFSQNITTVVGAVHQLEIICTLNSGTFAYNVWDGTGGYSLGPADLSDGTTTVNFTPANTTTRIMVSRKNASTSGNYTLKSISVKEVNIEDLKGSNDGSNVGATIDTDLYGGDTPVIPRGIDNARTVQADAIGVGSALFDGTDDYISIGSPTNLDNVFSGGGTFSAWIKPIGWGESSSGRIASKSASANVGGWNFYVGSAGRLGFIVDWDSTDLQFETANSTISSLNAWYHVAVTYNSSAAAGTDPKLYINGVHITSYATSTDSVGSYVTDASSNLQIGNRGSGTDREFDGNICQVGIWNAALTQAQIQSVMEKTFEELTADDKSILGAELFADGDMETGNEDDWDDNLDDTEATLSDPYGKVTKSWARSGTQVLSMKRESGSGGLAQNVTGLSTSTLYKYTAYVRTDSGDTVIDNLIHMYLDDDNNLGSGATSLNSTVNGLNTKDTWTKLEVYFVPPNASIWIGFWIGGDNSIWYVDDMSLKEVTHDLVSYWALDEAVRDSVSTDWVYDKVAGLTETLGSELIGDPSFEDASYWSTSGGSGTLNVNTANAGKLTGIAVHDIALSVDSLLTSGKVYKIQLTCDSYTDGKIRALGGYYNTTWDVVFSEGVFTKYVASIGTTFHLFFHQYGDFTFTDISCKEVLGNVGELI